MCNNVLKRVARTYVTIPAIQCLKFSLFCTLFFLNLLQMFEENSKSHIQRPHYKRGNLALGQLQETVRHCTRTQILSVRLVIYYAYQIIERRKWQYPGLQRMAGIKQDAQEDVLQNFPAGFADGQFQVVEYVATDRSKWRQAAARCAQRHGRN